MTSFKDSFKDALKQGLEAKRKAAEARREVDEVLAQASEVVQTGMNAPVHFIITEVDRPRREQTHTESMLDIPAPRGRVPMLLAQIREGRGFYQRLAEVEFSEIGYPITLMWNHRIERAGDRTGFEKVLQALVGSASTGEKIELLVKEWSDAGNSSI